MKVLYECEHCGREFVEFEACREHEALHPKFKGIQKELSDPDHPEQLPEVLWLKFGENGMIGIYELNRLDRVCELGIPAFDRDDFFEKYGEGEMEHGAITCSVFPGARVTTDLVKELVNELMDLEPPCAKRYEGLQERYAEDYDCFQERYNSITPRMREILEDVE